MGGYDEKTSHAGHTGQAALSALLEISLAVVPALLFFYTYVHHYPSATFFLRGNVLFFVVYFAILVLFMTIYGSFSVRKYRTRELVFAFGLSSFFTDTIAYFLMCMIAKMLLPPKYVILTLLLQVPRGDRDLYSRPHSGRPARAAGAGAADRAGDGCRGERPQQV